VVSTNYGVFYYVGFFCTSVSF